MRVGELVIYLSSDLSVQFQRPINPEY